MFANLFVKDFHQHLLNLTRFDEIFSHLGIFFENFMTTSDKLDTFLVHLFEIEKLFL